MELDNPYRSPVAILPNRGDCVRDAKRRSLRRTPIWAGSITGWLAFCFRGERVVSDIHDRFSRAAMSNNYFVDNFFPIYDAAIWLMVAALFLLTGALIGSFVSRLVFRDFSLSLSLPGK